MKEQTKTIAITGGSGSLGKELVKQLLDNGTKAIRILSRDEEKLLQMEKHFKSDKLRFFVGDVRDLERLKLAFDGVDHVIHAAALKHVKYGEYNPFEFVLTNITGTMNVILACLYCKVKKAVLISTDKAVDPVNLYGATKMCAEKIFINANSYSGEHGPRLSVVRYGNVLGSRGSVVTLFSKWKKEGKPIKVTNPMMTRFWITIQDAAAFVLEALNESEAGEIWIPIMRSYSMHDLACMFANEYEKIGSVSGEKIHEEIISYYEFYRRDMNHYVIGKDGCTHSPISSDRALRFSYAEMKEMLEKGGWL